MTLTYDLEDGLIIWRTGSAVDYERDRSVLEESLERARRTGRRDWPFLIDARGSRVQRSTYELRGIADMFATQRDLLASRGAFVVDDPLLHSDGRFFAVFLDVHGIELELFESYEEARRWLLNGSDLERPLGGQ